MRMHVEALMIDVDAIKRCKRRARAKPLNTSADREEVGTLPFGSAFRFFFFVFRFLLLMFGFVFGLFFRAFLRFL